MRAFCRSLKKGGSTTLSVTGRSRVRHGDNSTCSFAVRGAAQYRTISTIASLIVEKNGGGTHPHTLRTPKRIFLALSVPKAVFLIDGQRVQVGKQPALCLGQMQGNGSWLATGGQQLLDIVHVNARLVFRRKLLQRHQRRCQCFRHNPFVVARDSLFWHPLIPASCQSLSASSCSASIEKQACHVAAFGPSRQ